MFNTSTPPSFPPLFPARRSLITAACSSMLLLSACGGGGGADVQAIVASQEKTTADGAQRERLTAVSAFDAANALKVADENGSFVLNAPTLVYYGANGAYNALLLAAGTYRASNGQFGDPISGVYKAAYVVGTQAIEPFDVSKATKVADENGRFTLTAAGLVYYGANGTYASQSLAAGTYSASNTVFGDPIPGVFKSAYVVGTSAIAAFDAATAIKVADENSQFTLSSAGTVFFGAKGQFVSQRLAAGTYYASTALFGDPVSGVYKAAYVTDTSSITRFDLATAIKVAHENYAFTLTSDGTVFFGSGTTYTSKPLAAGTYVANPGLLGDPTPGVAKAAYVMNGSAITPFTASAGIKLANEGQVFYLSAAAQVFFGANASFTSKTLPAGTYNANAGVFGNPIDGFAKAAYVVGTASTPTFDANAAIKLTDEGGTFTLAYQSIVFFGANDTYTARLLPAGTYTANSGIFADLVPGVVKTAYVLSTDDQGPRASAAPTIGTQPSAVAVRGGSPATFNVAATSETIVRFQWSRNGVAIPAATASSYTVPATQLSDSGARFAVTVSNNAGSTASTAATLTVNASMAQVATAQRPFSDQSLWNSRPTKVTLGTYVVPASYYYPVVGEGDLSVTAFVASNSDGAVSVAGPVGSSGIYIPDAETYVSQITIPHWPANVVPATGDDGHADIVDAAANRIHSFYKLRKDGGQWRAAQYTWTALDGRGWGTPGQYFQGSRAAGVVPMAGLIRTFELDDGLPAYKHALAMSMPSQALSANPTYTFPATAADIYASTTNSGTIPEGALMMLPADFDLSRIKDARLLKVARTLQSYGAYVVDANVGTPFIVYVEIGSGFNLMPTGWDAEIAAELDYLRSQLRQAVATSDWVDANGAAFTPQRDFNVLSLRGSWYVLQGSAAGTFDTWTQKVTFPDNGQKTVQLNSTGRSVPGSLWGAPTAGRTFRLEVQATGGATLQMSLVNGSGATVYGTAELGNGGVHVFTWPAGSVTPYVRLTSGSTGGGTVSATLVAQ